MSDRIEKQIDIHAPLERVWRAVTDHREFGEWFRVALEGPFVPGQLATGKILHPGYEHVPWKATVQSIEPMRRFAFTWHPYAGDPDFDYSNEPPTLVEFLLDEIPGGTRVRVIESGFDKVPADRRSEAFLRNEKGWTHQVVNIQNYVASHP